MKFPALFKNRYPRPKGRGSLIFTQNSLHPRDKSRGSFAQNRLGKKFEPFIKKIDFSISKISFTYILFTLLIVSSYYIGNLRAQVSFLKKSSVAATQGPQTAGNKPASQPAGKVPEVTDKDHVRGSRKAKVVLIEYGDFECPFCKSFHPTMKEALGDFGSDVSWVYRHYPLSFHANAQKEAEATECAAQLGGDDKFWEFVDKIFERTSSNGTGFALEKLTPLAAEIGLNQDEFKNCLDGGRYTQAVKDSFQAGTSAGVTGTPATFVVAPDGSSELIPGALPLSQVKELINKALKK